MVVKTHPVVTVELDPPTRRRLKQGVAAAMSAVNNGHRESSVHESQFAIRELGSFVARNVFGDRLLSKVRSHLKSGGIVLWKGLPQVEDNGNSETGELTFGQALVAAIAGGPTQSLAYHEEDGGRHFQRLFPVFPVEGVQNSGKTPGDLWPHLDNPFLCPWAQPEVIHLACVNNDARVPTLFYTMDAVIRGLTEGYSERVVRLLQKPVYTTAISSSFIQNQDEKSVTTRARPILYRTRDQKGAPTHFLGKAYDMAVREGNDQHHYQHALGAYQEVLKTRADLAISILALPGQAISFNQQRLLHGRGAIGSKGYREMVRAYGRFSFKRLELHTYPAPFVNYIFDAKGLIDR